MVGHLGQKSTHSTKPGCLAKHFQKTVSGQHNGVTAQVQENSVNFSHGNDIGLVHTNTQEQCSQLEVNSILVLSILRLLSGSGLRRDIVSEK